MTYITREDGERFVVPSYRDVIVAKNANVLKKEINILTKSYGNYITLQRKGPIQYEIAFSQDTGYLLGETIWNQLKRPLEMIYCEAVPNTTEAILVIVKEGSVYLDGSFPVESIPEELIIFLSQQNNFDIYINGDVPISQTPEVGKFSFEANSVRSFTVLEKPLFPTLPLLRIFQLQPVDQVLKTYGIGILPAKKLAIIGIILLLLGFMWTYMTSTKEAVTQIIVSQVNPYQPYIEALSSPAPNTEVSSFLHGVQVLMGMPGWNMTQLNYHAGVLVATVQSGGGNLHTLTNWAEANKASVNLTPTGVNVSINIPLKNRPTPTKIYKIQDVTMTFLDRLAQVYPGNNIKIAPTKNKEAVFIKQIMSLTLSGLSPAVIALIGDQMVDMPFVINGISLKQDNGLLSGSITFDILGN